MASKLKKTIRLHYQEGRKKKEGREIAINIF